MHVGAQTLFLLEQTKLQSPTNGNLISLGHVEAIDPIRRNKRQLFMFMTKVRRCALDRFRKICDHKNVMIRKIVYTQL